MNIEELDEELESVASWKPCLGCGMPIRIDEYCCEECWKAGLE